MIKFILGVAHRALSAFVLMKLWLWIVVPIFHVPTGEYFQFVGVSYFVNVVFLNTESQIKFSEKSDEAYFRYIVQSFILQLISLLIGYFYSLFL